MIRIYALALVAGSLGADMACGPGPVVSSPSVVPDHPDHPERGGREQLVAEAERLVARSQELDYRDPARGAREAIQHRGLDLYVEACGLGDARACWRAACIPTSGPYQTWSRAVTPTSENCLRGDVMSCRVLEGGIGHIYERFADAPGLCHRGLGIACYATGRAITAGQVAGDADAMYEAGCNRGDTRSCVELLRRAIRRGLSTETQAVLRERARTAGVAQCKQGFADLCMWFDTRTALAPFDSVAGFAQLAEQSAAQGCRAGSLEDCETQYALSTALADRDAAILQVCATQGQLCSQLAELRGKGTIGERDAYEHGCQRSDFKLCVELVHGYQAKRWPEPVSGRATDIAAWLCQDRTAPACRQLTE